MASEFVSIPVPVERVQEVYQLLASPPRLAETALGNGAGSWPETLLHRAYRESPPPMRVVFEYLAMHADETVTAQDLSDAVAERLNRPGYERRQLAGVLGAFGRRWKNRYKGGGRPDGRWPFHSEWSSEHRMFIYRMDSSVAETIRRAQ